MNKNKQVLFGVIAVVAVLCIAVALVVNQGRQTESNKDVIKIGVIIPLTGAASEFGDINQETSRLMADSFNKEIQEGNTLYTLFIEDSQTTAKGALSAYQKIEGTQSDVQIYSVELSSAASTVAPFTQEKNQFLICIAGTDALSDYTHILRVYPSPESICAEVVEFLNGLDYNNRQSKFSIIGIDDEFGRSVSNLLSQSLKDLDHISVSTDFFSASTDTRSQAIKYNDSDVFFIVGFGPKMGMLIKDIQVHAPKARIIASPEFTLSDVYSHVKIDDPNLFYVGFDIAQSELEDLFVNLKLTRKPNLLDMLVHDAFCLVRESVTIVKESNQQFIGQNLSTALKGKSFIIGKRNFFVDQQGNVQYRMKIRQAEEIGK